MELSATSFSFGFVEDSPRRSYSAEAERLRFVGVDPLNRSRSTLSSDGCRRSRWLSRLRLRSSRLPFFSSACDFVKEGDRLLRSTPRSADTERSLRLDPPFRGGDRVGDLEDDSYDDLDE